MQLLALLFVVVPVGIIIWQAARAEQPTNSGHNGRGPHVGDGGPL